MPDLIYHPTSSRKLNRSPKTRPKRIKLETFHECLTSQNKKNTNVNWDALEPSKETIKTELLLHQKYGLGWLYHRENSNELQPFWVEEEDNYERGGNLYRNVLNNKKREEKRPNLEGGVFADDMRLGRTLTLLSLISTDYTSYTKLNSSDLSLENLEEGYDDDKLRKRKHSNEVLVTPVLSTWTRQLDEHTKPGSLKLFVYNHVLPDGNGIKLEELRKYDIVLTTYDSGMVFKMVLKLSSDMYGVVQSMPIVSTSCDMYYAMAFLSFYPFSVKFGWQSLVQRPLKNGKVPLSHLQDLMATISLRRLKTDCLVKLPPKAVETFFLELSDEE
ncbi:hypothetical protein C5167_013684 [Papaver somniferum]|uniref:SNF2 N-terminal domain-containing protein n=1 Tax=Papaver somniferum TaxID=3469 RepID=A0A4Y7J111_PAPSO|nr:hypothetical protein C5167_013684 [Papaver somniferum]